MKADPPRIEAEWVDRVHAALQGGSRPKLHRAEASRGDFLELGNNHSQALCLCKGRKWRKSGHLLVVLLRMAIPPHLEVDGFQVKNKSCALGVRLQFQRY